MSQLFNIFFNVNCIFTIGHVIALFTFCHKPHQVRSFYTIDVNCTYTIDHVIFLSVFHHKPHLVQSVMKIQFHFLLQIACYRPHLYDQSHRCPIQFQSKEAPDLICHVVVLSGVRCRLHPVRSVMKVQYLFGIECTCIINHVIILSSFHHRS